MTNPTKDTQRDELIKLLKSHFDSFFHQVYFYIAVKNWYETGIEKTADDLLSREQAIRDELKSREAQVHWKDIEIKKLEEKVADHQDRCQRMADGIEAEHRRALEAIKEPLKFMLERQGSSVPDVLRAYVDGTREALSIITEELEGKE